MFRHSTLGLICDELLADLRWAKSQNWTVLEHRSPIGGCSNCSGQTFHHIGFHPGARTKEAHRVDWFDAGRRLNVETRTYPCPVCNQQDTFSRVSMLWEMSGLVESEQNFHLDWLNGKGKDAPLRAAWKILAMSPCPLGWLTLFGDNGKGKSGILKSMTAAFIRVGLEAHYTTASRMLLEIQNTFGGKRDEETEAKILSQYSGYVFLAIDEVDLIGGSEWAGSTLALILDDRYNRRTRCATAIATNTKPASLPERFRYLHSRMMDGEIIQVAGDTLRGA